MRKATAILFLCVPGILLSACEKRVAQPNIFLICVGTLRADMLAAYGGEGDATPFLDRLASTGVRFQHAYTSAPWLLPATASLLTGLYPSTHGAVGEWAVMNPEAPTLATLLRAAGYSTAGFVTHPLLGKDRGFGKGFDRYYQHKGKSAGDLVGEATRWLDAQGDGPVFFFLHLNDPHAPYNPPGKVAVRYYPPEAPLIQGGAADMLSVMRHWPKPEAKGSLAALKALYRGEVDQADRAVQDLHHHLRRRGMLEGAIIVIVSDNGEEFMEHGLMNHGFSLYEEQVRIPMIFHAPEKLPEAKAIRENVGLIDVAPTLLDFAGLIPPEGMSGRSLLPLMSAEQTDGGAAAGFLERTIFMETKRHGPDRVALVKGRWKYIATPTFTIQGRTFRRALYNLDEDPGEHHNLLDRRPDKLASFETTLAASGLYRQRRMWSLRFGGSKRPVLYSGKLTTSGRFRLLVKDSPRYTIDGGGQVFSGDYLLQGSPHFVRFAALGSMGGNGFHFIVEPEGALVEATLLINGRKRRKRISLGKKNRHPTKVPFVLPEGGVASSSAPGPAAYFIGSQKVWVSAAPSGPVVEDGPRLSPEILRSLAESAQAFGLVDSEDLPRILGAEPFVP